MGQLPKLNERFTLRQGNAVQLPSDGQIVLILAVAVTALSVLADLTNADYKRSFTLFRSSFVERRAFARPRAFARTCSMPER